MVKGIRGFMLTERNGVSMLILCYYTILFLFLLCAGSGNLLQGLEIGIGTMRLKEKSRFLIRAKYAFGERGCPPRIPPNATCKS